MSCFPVCCLRGSWWHLKNLHSDIEHWRNDENFCCAAGVVWLCNVFKSPIARDSLSDGTHPSNLLVFMKLEIYSCLLLIWKLDNNTTITAMPIILIFEYCKLSFPFLETRHRPSPCVLRICNALLEWLPRRKAFDCSITTRPRNFDVNDAHVITEQNANRGLSVWWEAYLNPLTLFFRISMRCVFVHRWFKYRARCSSEPHATRPFYKKEGYLLHHYSSTVGFLQSRTRNRFPTRNNSSSNHDAWPQYAGGLPHGIEYSSYWPCEATKKFPCVKCESAFSSASH